MRYTKTLTHTKKTTKNTRCTKHRQAQKKNKKLKIPGTMGPLLSSCWNLCFFCFFWCLSMFGASSGLFFCFFLVPASDLWQHMIAFGGELYFLPTLVTKNCKYQYVWQLLEQKSLPHEGPFWKYFPRGLNSQASFDIPGMIVTLLCGKRHFFGGDLWRKS